MCIMCVPTRQTHAYELHRKIWVYKMSYNLKVFTQFYCTVQQLIRGNNDLLNKSILLTETLSKKAKRTHRDTQADPQFFFFVTRRYMLTGGFKQTFGTLSSSQLINRAALSRETAGLINSKGTPDEVFYVQQREAKGNKIINLEIPHLS